MRALAIKQPWAEAIVRGWKDVENRSRSTRFRGPVLIHASARFDEAEVAAYRELIQARGIFGGGPSAPMTMGEVRNSRCGGIVGIAEVVDCVAETGSPWFVGPYGWALANPRPIKLVPCRGMLGFFDPGADIVDTALERLASGVTA